MNSFFNTAVQQYGYEQALLLRLFLALNVIYASLLCGDVFHCVLESSSLIFCGYLNMLNSFETFLKYGSLRFNIVQPAVWIYVFEVGNQ